MVDERGQSGPHGEQAGDGDERSVLSRWSRRKAAVRAGLELEEPPEAHPPEPSDAPRPDSLPEVVPEDTLPADAEPAPLPALTELDDDSDYSAFLREKVPAAMRKQALRQLFSAAKFNIVDGLDDYDDDFTQILPLGDIVTSDMKHQAEVQAQRAKEKAEEEARKAALGEEEDAEGESPEALEVDEAEVEDAEALEADSAAQDADDLEAERIDKADRSPEDGESQ